MTMNKPLTTGDLIAMLQEYPTDTPVFDGRGYDLRASSVTEMKYDDWAKSTPSEDGEIPGVGVGVSIGRRY